MTILYWTVNLLNIIDINGVAKRLLSQLKQSIKDQSKNQLIESIADIFSDQILLKLRTIILQPTEKLYKFGV
jgi:hypothetical protein